MCSIPGGFWRARLGKGGNARLLTYRASFYIDEEVLTMRKATLFLSLIAVVSWANQTLAGKPEILGPLSVVHFQVPGGPAFEPQPEPIYPPAPAPGPGTIQPEPMPSSSQTGPEIELYPYVRYKDLDEKHPQGVPMIVSVPDPATGWKGKYLCPPPMVNVAICVPPNCGPPRVKYSRLFRQYKFDFGKYAVDVRLRKGRIEVDYQD
jgi:hypothetical protein